MTPPLLSIKNLTVTYQGKRGSVTAVDDVSLTLHAGQVLGIVGESGSGKSTLGLALMGLLPKTASVSGSITINGVEITTASQAEINALRGRTMG
ncbi:MAG TPA: ATP-binding cassette domain-containing protein, partial [Devosia sp.]|nr:ATP-binding cassette domain-containing protein [Devosia sp.]